MLQSECHFTLRTHQAYVHISAGGLIHCFKYNDHQCAWEQFEDFDQLSDWLFLPLDPFQFRLILEE
jgi:hypothetical protein